MLEMTNITCLYYETILLDWCSGLALLNKNDVKDDLLVQFVQPSPLTIVICLKIVDRFPEVWFMAIGPGF